MRGRARTLLIIVMFILILYALAQNGTLGTISLGNLFPTSNGTLFFSVTARPIFSTAPSRPIIATVPPYMTPVATLVFGVQETPGSTNGAYAGQAGCVVPNGWVPYTIQNGDTIGTIAAAYNVALDQFVSANCLANPDLVYAGQIVYVPGTR